MVEINRHLRTLARLSIGLALAASAEGCMFRGLARDLAHVNQLGMLQGRVDRDVDVECPIVVVAYSVTAGKAVDSFVLSRPGSYFFALPAGTYRVAAFDDRNRDFTYQPADEPAAEHGPSMPVVLRPGQRVDGADIRISATVGPPLAFAVVEADSLRREVSELPDIELGTIVDIADARFSTENGKLGLWKPVDFVSRVGAGIYFLEPYDPDRIPVLFVHGITGQPGEWRPLIARLDRQRFQPWLLYYPSALHLADLGRALVRWMGVLQARHQFRRLVIVAHSMGGLVARSALTQVVADNPERRLVSIDAFITISTPWGGHAAAQKGVERAPVVAPAWEDLTPGSPFLVDLMRHQLPRETRYFLFFSHRGRSRLISGNNDKVVTLASQLPHAIQADAAAIRGFDEDHRTILTSAAVADQLNAILATVRE